MAAETNFVEEKQKCHIYSLDTHICTFGLQWTIFIFLVLNWNKLTMEANEGGILLKTEMIPPPPPPRHALPSIASYPSSILLTFDCPLYTVDVLTF